MNYRSTRAQVTGFKFCDVVLEGLAADGGLMVPEHYPKLTLSQLETWRSLSYADLAHAVMTLYIDDIDASVLKRLLDATYTAEYFGHDDITPVKRLDNGLWLLGLSGGPTLAFKDIAMRFLGNIFEYVLGKTNRQLNILGATSGDTGSAAEYAMRDKRHVRVFMLSPYQKMSAFQAAQMYSLQDENIFNIAIDAPFDNCQDIVKAIQGDSEFKQKYQLGAVNSINWARILAQVVYYFKAYFAVTQSNNEKVSFSVPSGNFGNVLAGHVARMMGLPIERLLVATNENDVLHEFFQTGIYRPRAASEVHITSSPSMDIAKASNLERFIFDVMGRSGEATAALWDMLKHTQQIDLSAKLAQIRHDFGFNSGHCNHAERVAVIRQMYQQEKVLIDPHTAAGIHVALQQRQADEKIICLETALPVKFAATMHEAVGDDLILERPQVWQDIEKQPQKFALLADDVHAVKAYLQRHIS